MSTSPLAVAPGPSNTGYRPPFEPYAHQRAALAKMAGQEAFALFMAMRTGKTKVLLDDFGRLELQGRVQNLLVLAPGGVYRTWQGAVEEHLSIDLRQRTLVHVWESGSNSVKAQFVRLSFMEATDRPRILLMNIEALSSVKAARDLAKTFLAQAPAMMAVDESTTIKTPKSKRTKFINTQLSPLAAWRRILSGLPSPKSPLDLYSQFEFLDWSILGFRSYYAFRARYAELRRVQFGGRDVQLVVGFRNLEDLQRRIEPCTSRALLEDCYDLPPKIYLRREVDLTPEQKRLYGEMKFYATAKLSDTKHITSTIVIAQIIRMHQILCGHAVDEAGGVHPVDENRTDELLNLLTETDSAKAIVWCSYDYNVQAVAAALQREFGAGSVARFWGGNRSTREAEEQRFMNDLGCRFMVATAAAGGRGRQWAVADLVVYYSNSTDLEHRSQSEERPQAIGKIRSVAYVDLVAPGTIDEKIIKLLRNKIDLASAVIGDAYREWLI